LPTSLPSTRQPTDHAVAALRSIAERHQPLSPYRTDPVGWVQDRLEATLWSKQREILEAVRDHPYTAVRSCHGVGKSWIAAALAAWWIDVHPPGTAFVVSTAPTDRQVKAVLWRYIRRSWRAFELPGEVLQTAEWKIDGDLVGIGRKPADHDAHGFQGIHAPYLLVVLDEACGIPEQLWVATDALVTNESDTGRVLAIGNPDDPVSHFQNACRPDSGWHVIGISAHESPNFTDEGKTLPKFLTNELVGHSYVEKMARWGTDSPIYTSKVLGEFPESTDEALIPLSWIRAAQDRWQQWHDDGRNMGVLDQVGVDVAGGGADRTVFARRHGNVILELDEWQGADTRDTMMTAGRVASTIAHGGLAVIDWTGLGQGVFDRVAEQGLSTVAFVAGARTDLYDSTGAVQFVNCRSAAWWGLREYLNPDHNPTLCLPPSEQLAAELSAPSWQLTSAAKVRVESKDDMKKRIGRSTDLADAVCLAVWQERLPAPGQVVHSDELDPDGIVSISAY